MCVLNVHKLQGGFSVKDYWVLLWIYSPIVHGQGQMFRSQDVVEKFFGQLPINLCLK